MSGICYVRIDFTDVNNYEKLLSPDSSIFRKQSAYYQHYFFTYFGNSSNIKGFVCGIDCSPPLYTINDRVTEEAFLVFIYAGKGTVNGIPFGANQFFYIPPNVPTHLVSDPEAPWKLCWISWRGTMSDYFENELNKFEYGKIYSIPNAYGMQRIISGMLYSELSNAKMNEAVSHFADYVISLISKNPIAIDTFFESEAANQRKINYVEKAKMIMAEQYATINIANLSKMLYLNSKYFCQIFHEVTGITPQQHLIDIRLRNSVFHLGNSNLTLKNISELCGYSSYTGYVDAFKQKYGESPKEYRKKLNTQGAFYEKDTK